MEKKWMKTGEGMYTFQVDGAEAGEMKINWNALNQQASAEMDGRNYSIARVGFWKNTVEVKDAANMSIARIYPDKWFANYSVMEYKGFKYKVVLRNRPMAEYAITRDDVDVLAYGILSEKGKSGVRISGAEAEPIFHAILWYLFAPIVHENMGETFSPFWLIGV